jgi:hypothetical protein
MTSSSLPKRIALVTGANAGIGYEICKRVDSRLGFMALHVPDRTKKAEAAVASLMQEEHHSAPENSTAEPLVLALYSFQSIRDAASTFVATKRPLHVCHPQCRHYGSALEENQRRVGATMASQCFRTFPFFVDFFFRPWTQITTAWFKYPRGHTDCIQKK